MEKIYLLHSHFPNFSQLILSQKCEWSREWKSGLVPNTAYDSLEFQWIWDYSWHDSGWYFLHYVGLWLVSSTEYRVMSFWPEHTALSVGFLVVWLVISIFLAAHRNQCASVLLIPVIQIYCNRLSVKASEDYEIHVLECSKSPI